MANQTCIKMEDAIVSTHTTSIIARYKISRIVTWYDILAAGVQLAKLTTAPPNLCWHINDNNLNGHQNLILIEELAFDMYILAQISIST